MRKNRSNKKKAPSLLGREGANAKKAILYCNYSINYNYSQFSKKSSTIKNCLFYVAYSQRLEGKLLQQQAQELLNHKGLSLLVVSDSSLQEDFIRSTGEISYE